ncbi:MAG TPA: hypothetical protein VK387_02700, partial [Thermoleophilaceae bacterium]|nr:hypothetical protein [Thermoleophilaceae bacterium]
MSTAEYRAEEGTLQGGGLSQLARPQIVEHGVRGEPPGWLGWITTTDHKRIGILYLVATFMFFVLGGVEALLMRLQLGAAQST